MANVDSVLEYKVYFKPERGIARLVINQPTFDEKTDSMTFTLRPTPAFLKVLGEKATNDKNYRREIDAWVKTIPVKNISAPSLKNAFPEFMTWEVDVNWEGKVIDTAGEELRILKMNLASLQKERDAGIQTIQHLNRELLKLAKHPDIVRNEIFKQEANKVNTINPVILTSQNQGSEHK